MPAISIDSALLKAKSHAKRGELDQARSMLQAVLDSFPSNKRARKELTKLETFGSGAQSIIHPPKEQIDEVIGLYNQNRMVEVINIGQKLTLAFPTSFVLWNIFGAANMALGQLEVAAQSFQRASAISPNFPYAQNNLGNVLKMQGQIQAAIVCYRTALELKSDYVDAHNNLGTALKELGDIEKSISSYKRALQIDPSAVDPRYNLGLIWAEQGNTTDALSAFRRTVEIKPDHTDAHLRIGDLLAQDGKFLQSIEAYQRILQINPLHAEAQINLGNALQNSGQLEHGLTAYHRALEIDPDSARAYYNIGVVLNKKGEPEKAIKAYAQTLVLDPQHSDASNNLGATLQELGKLDQAIAAYKRTISIDPNYAEAYYNMGNAYNSQGKTTKAISSYEKALALRPRYVEAYNNQALTLQEMGRHHEAISSYKKALEINPAHATAEAQMLHQRQHICDFSDARDLKEASTRLGITTTPVSPFPGLSWIDNPEVQLERTKAWTKKNEKYAPLNFISPPNNCSDRLRIGYFSADFHDHATMYLMAGLLREHSRENFETYAYSYGLTKSGSWREQAMGNTEHFFDVTNNSDREIADLARSHFLDIAIDLKGYTMRTRSNIFQFRLAPIQVNFLGFPGTMGAPFIDYIIADKTVIPMSQRQHYTENVIYLPNSYQPNDNKREIKDVPTSRADFGLPDDGFVFCCFNNTYKISPTEFDIWMRLLKRVDGSVLWLLKSNQWAETNLYTEARNHRIDPARIIFAEKLAHTEHLARHKHADLFIDTFNVNAHTTASDALWAGLPVVTKLGNQFAARVAASLLYAVGLPELITETEAEYESLILELAAAPEELRRLKEKLAGNRETKPLFDTKRYTKHFEQGLQKAHHVYMEKKSPEDIFIED
jgi:protein O-GlcNAc transferase